MEILRKVASFTTSMEERKEIYILQKAAVRIIVGQNYTNYENALMKADLEPLKIRRDELCKTFAEKKFRK